MTKLRLRMVIVGCILTSACAHKPITNNTTALESVGLPINVYDHPAAEFPKSQPKPVQMEIEQAVDLPPESQVAAAPQIVEPAPSIKDSRFNAPEQQPSTIKI